MLLFVILSCLLVVACTIAFMKKRKHNFGLETSQNYALEPDYISVHNETRMDSTLTTKNMAIEDDGNYVYDLINVK